MAAHVGNCEFSGNFVSDNGPAAPVELIRHNLFHNEKQIRSAQ